MNRWLRCVFIPALAITLIGASLARTPSARASAPETPGADAGPINPTCPVMAGEAIDPQFTTTYRGVDVGLCCRRCLAKFDADPEAYIANLPRAQTAAFDSPEGEGHPHGKSDPTGAAHDDEPAPVEHSGGHDAAIEGAVAATHDHDHNDASPRILTWIGEFHPPATDIPIAFFLGAALAEIMLVLTGREMFRHAASFCVWVAAFGAVAAAALGWLNGGFAVLDDDWVLATHRWLGTGVAVLGLLTLALLVAGARTPRDARARTRYRVALFVVAGLVAATGFFGGSLVYGIDHYAW